MKTRLKKLVAAALVFAMLLTVLPAQAFANSRALAFDEDAMQALSEFAPADEPVEAAFPAMKEELEVDDALTVSIEAEEGAFPEGTSVAAEKVELADVQDVVDQTADVSGQVLVAVDITFTKDGEELQPAEGKAVKVSFAAPELKDVEDASVVHIADDAEEAELVETVDAEDDAVAFEAEQFSIYAVVGNGQTDPKARLKVSFYNTHLTRENKEITSVFVKNDDNLAMIEKIVYDPGIDEVLPSGYLFRGWSIDDPAANDGSTTNIGPDYDSDTKVYNIDGVQEYLAGLTENNAITEGDTLGIYAIILKTYSVTFVDTYVEEVQVGDEVQEVEKELVLGTASVPLVWTSDATDYLVNMSYNLKPEEKFDGWKVVEGAANITHIGGTSTVVDDSTLINNNTTITIKGPIKLQKVSRPGHWLVFDENGKGATYCAPQFVEGDGVTSDPRPNSMTRFGYTFDGWYYGSKDENGNVTFGNRFVFGNALTENTVIYAKWTPNTSAGYTVVFWLENAEGTGYDLNTSVSDVGNVGDYIPYQFVDNMDEDYASGYGTKEDETSGANPKPNIEQGLYKGFCLQHDTETGKPLDRYGNPIEDLPKIQPEGDAVLNLYYKRITYTFKFYLYWQPGEMGPKYEYTTYTGSPRNGDQAWGLIDGGYVQVYYRAGQWRFSDNNNGTQYTGTVYTRGAAVPDEQEFHPSDYRFWYANNSGGTADPYVDNGLVTWHNQQSEHPTAPSYEIKYDDVGGYRFYYFTITAKYGEDISEKWPTYDRITGANGREAVSYVMMVGTKLKPRATNQGSGTVKGIITILNENILGKMEDANGNYVVVRFPTSFYNWRYHIWYEVVDSDPDNVPKDEDGNPKPTHEYEGKLYYEDVVLVVRSSNTTDANQNEPKYQGYDYVTRVGQDFQGGHWTTTEGNTTLYHLNYIYDRQDKYIHFMDGLYVGGNSNTDKLYHNEQVELYTSPKISYGNTVAEYADYEPDPSKALVSGFVFDGWYTDPDCNMEYVFTTMPVGGITVYAKWIQVQYRVFLHPNAHTVENGTIVRDDTLSWGKDAEGHEVSQAMNFRISYQKTLSAPTGKRDGYEFGGWYTDDETFNNYFDGDFTPLTDEVATVLYDKRAEENLTDNMDRWGLIEDTSPSPEGSTGPGYNSDLYSYDKETRVFEERDRTWITRKLDLYAKWKEVVIGAKGINVVYDSNSDDVPPVDSMLYEENTKAYAQAATTTSATVDGKRQQFLHWNIMQWDATANDNQGAYVESGLVALPGEDFSVRRAFAKITDDDHDDQVVDAEHLDANGHYTYTVLLKAEYAPIDEPVPTFMNWYRNWEGDAAKEIKEGDEVVGYDVSDYLLHSTPNVYINVAIPIYTLPEEEGDEHDIPTRPGYKFLGWAKGTEKTEKDGKPEAYVGYDDLYLKWIEDPDGSGGHYEVDGMTGEITHVAADEYSPYEAWYAVWERLPFQVIYSSEPNITYEITIDEDRVSEDGEGYDIVGDINGNYGYGNDEQILATKIEVIDGNEVRRENVALPGVHEEYLYGGYYTEGPAEDGKWNKDAACSDYMGTELKPIGGETYWVKEVDKTAYLTPYYKFTYVKATKRTTGLWVMSCLDDLNYAEAGFVAWNAEYKDASNATQTIDGFNDFTIQQGFKSLTVYTIENNQAKPAAIVTPDLVSKVPMANNAYQRLGYFKSEDLFGESTFVNVISKQRKSATFTIVPFWVTNDGIPVLGVKYRTIYIHPEREPKIAAKRSDDLVLKDSEFYYEMWETLFEKYGPEDDPGTGVGD